jgi:protein-S-isoprenylcysteine O-methyltransferase Ste14
MYLGGTAVVTWAMAVNTHFEKTVRIQSDRGHTVCDRGPYRWVRHPGYVGASLAFPLATPLLLGSAWAFVPAALCVAMLVLRTALEDRMLRAELEGYEAFAGKTRYRLLPGIW